VPYDRYIYDSPVYCHRLDVWLWWSVSRNDRQGPCLRLIWCWWEFDCNLVKKGTLKKAILVSMSWVTVNELTSRQHIPPKLDWQGRSPLRWKYTMHSSAHSPHSTHVITSAFSQ
jgi:hypothetical protein